MTNDMRPFCRDGAGNACPERATVATYDPEGVCRGFSCKAHGAAVVAEYREQLGEAWSLRELCPACVRELQRDGEHVCADGESEIRFDDARHFGGYDAPTHYGYFVEVIGDARDRAGRLIGLRFGGSYVVAKRPPLAGRWRELTRREAQRLAR